MNESRGLTATFILKNEALTGSFRKFIQAMNEAALAIQSLGFRLGPRPHGMTWEHFARHHGRKHHPPIKANRRRVHRRRK